MRFASVVVALLVVPSLASAQFTTVLTPPKKEPAPAVATTPERAARDTAERRTLTNMKAWVDSAAAALDVEMPAPDTVFAGDSAVVAPEPEPAPAPPESPREETLTFRDGAPAPDTATDLPLLAVLALGSLGVGAVLLWRPRA